MVLSEDLRERSNGKGSLTGRTRNPSLDEETVDLYNKGEEYEYNNSWTSHFRQKKPAGRAAKDRLEGGGLKKETIS